MPLAGHVRNSLRSCRLHAAAESVASTSDQDEPLVDETGTMWPAKKQVSLLAWSTALGSAERRIGSKGLK